MNGLPGSFMYSRCLNNFLWLLYHLLSFTSEVTFYKKLLLEAEDVVLCFRYWARHAQFNGLLVFDFQWHLGEFFLIVFLRTLELCWLIVFPTLTWILFAWSVNGVYLNVRTYKIYEKDVKYIFIFHKSSTDCQWHWSFKN